MKLEKEEALQFLVEFYFGEHHMPSKMKEWGEGWYVTSRSALATYDFNHLTRLVVLAHDMCLRVEIVPHGMSMYKLVVTKRQPEGKMWERHPNLEAHITEIRQSIKSKYSPN